MSTTPTLLFKSLTRSLSTPRTPSYQVTRVSRQLSNMATTQKAAIAKANGFLDFVNASPTPFHAVASSIKLLEQAGFKKILEKDSWSNTVLPGGKYYLTRNGSSIVAFAVGKKWKSGNPIAMIGAHTDSPTLRLKPVSKKTNAGFMQIGVETYGGGIWHTWFDRDLSIAGRVMVKEGENFVQKLVKVDRPIVRIPTLAIHLHRETNFDPNKETELFPITGLVAAELNRTGKTEKDVKKEAEGESQDVSPLKAMCERHHPAVLGIIAEHAGCEVDQIVDFELVLYDTQPAQIGGLNNELIFSARLDNLNMTYCSVMSLIESLKSKDALEDESSIRLVTCFDHEEIGSTTAQGAASNLLPAILRRLSVLPSNNDAQSEASYEKVGRRNSEGESSTAVEQTLATSFLISADMAHSVNPNYTHKYEADHRPEMNKGTVIKINANARYATSSPGIVLLQEIAKLAKPSADSEGKSGVPLQLFVVRNDSSCGSTIGPMLSAALGTRTLDLGNPQLSMHSIRECGGVYDVEHAIRLFESFFENFSKLESKILVD